jgi:outer membrane lipoprotein-sorting protein
VYADLVAGIGSPMSEEEEITSERLLHDDAGATTYQNLGKEMIGGRNSNKYKTVVNSSSTENVSHSETLIWIDEVLNMPIRSETTSPDGTRTTMELSNIMLDVDKRLFEIPNDYERISFSELRKRMTATE